MTPEGGAGEVCSRIIGPDGDEDGEEDQRSLSIGVEDIGDAEEDTDIDLPEEDLRQVGRHHLSLAVDTAYQDVEQVAHIGDEEETMLGTLIRNLVCRPEEVDGSG